MNTRRGFLKAIGLGALGAQLAPLVAKIKPTPAPVVRYKLDVDANQIVLGIRKLTPADFVKMAEQEEELSQKFTTIKVNGREVYFPFYEETPGLKWNERN